MTAPADDRAPRDPGVLLFGLAVVALGGWGLVTGMTVMFCAGGVNNQGFAWVIRAPGARVAAVGMLAFGVACLGQWWWQDRRAWPVPVGMAGLGVLALGQLLAWVA